MNLKLSVLSFWIAVLLPLCTNGQHKLTGVLRDSVGHTFLAGATVTIEGQNRSTNANGAGEFEIESRTATAMVTFSYIGYRTITRKVVADNRAVIDMNLDMEALQNRAVVRTSFELGYYGEPRYAPFGVILTNHLQSIGNTQLGITSIFKVWQDEYGFEAAINKELFGGIRKVVDNVFVGYKTVDYAPFVYSLKQVRGVVSRSIPSAFLSIDAGAAYNETFSNNETGIAFQYYVSGSLGATKVIKWFLTPALSGLGFHGTVNYHPLRTIYEVGTFKSFSFKRFPSMVAMVKYYNYQEIDGWMLSLRFNLFSNEYYCCYSYAAHAREIAAFR
ncbi:carboxypeptidase-like regulatory domain-containing protein [Chryseolinea sp. T2]|uniref:carboxypeptidase-like regulatory domain-containing protein n=1 Tax=Chryseolinea sp. T2 TaxID=3129255 RepID=UPI0030780DB7